MSECRRVKRRKLSLYDYYGVSKPKATKLILSLVNEMKTLFPTDVARLIADYAVESKVVIEKTILTWNRNFDWEPIQWNGRFLIIERGFGSGTQNLMAVDYETGKITTVTEMLEKYPFIDYPFKECDPPKGPDCHPELHDEKTRLHLCDPPDKDEYLLYDQRGPVKVIGPKTRTPLIPLDFLVVDNRTVYIIYVEEKAKDPSLSLCQAIYYN